MTAQDLYDDLRTLIESGLGHLPVTVGEEEEPLKTICYDEVAEALRLNW